ncbi:MAG: c-type cytochrome [Rhodobacteraceae bacterium]|nr:c-type cytochrome [Paracoccaceae bacterium]
MSKWRDLALGAAVAAMALPAAADKLGLGRPALPEEITAWDVAVLPDGQGLPTGSGDVTTGDEVFAEKCAMCHGDFAEGIDNWPVLAGGQGTLTNRRPVKTIGSYWPHLSTVFDYVHRSMPFGAAQTVTPDETYAIVAFLLYSNGIVEDDFVLSNENFTEVTMPNAGGFYADDRPETEYPAFRSAPCMADCTAPVKITKRAVDLNVTPTDPDGKPAGTLPAIAVAAATENAGSPSGTVPSDEVQEIAKPADAGPDPAAIAAGEKVFKKCAACHKVGEGAKNSVGPVLNGIVGRTAGTVDGYKYSKAMAEAGAGGLVWTDETLDAYLEAPKASVPKTKMSFTGLKSPEDRADVIAYLESLGG